MTWLDLRNQCIELGFTKEKDFTKNKSAFYHAATWATNYIALNVKPIIKRYVITHRVLDNLLDYCGDSIVVYNGKPIIYAGKGTKAYYFECDGNAEVTIKDDSGETIVTTSSSNEFRAYRGFCNGDVTITFGGNYAYAIRNIAAYSILQSADIEDIPAYSEYIEYDFKQIDPNFMGFALEKPVFEGEYGYKLVSDYKREENRIIKFGRNEKGQFLIWYKVYPTPITADTKDDFNIEIEQVAADILPYLMSYRLWLDDDMQRAISYQNIADDLIQTLKVTELQEKKLPAYVDVEEKSWQNCVI